MILNINTTLPTKSVKLFAFAIIKVAKTILKDVQHCVVKVCSQMKGKENVF